jgi:DNA (cytosine-5)-methyltransferase 1
VLGYGINGNRSGLWNEAVRVIKEVSPRWVLCENVSALRTRGLPQVLCDLSEIGYDAEWYCYRASRFNAPHKRERIFIVAHRDSEHSEEHLIRDKLEHAGKEVSLGRGVHEPAWSEDWRAIATSLFRVDDGILHRVDRGTAVGNAVVPQQVYPILKAIADIERGN